MRVRPLTNAHRAARIFCDCVAMQMLSNIAPLGGLLKLRSGSGSADVSSFVFKLTCRYTSAVLVALSFLISSSNWLRYCCTTAS